MDVNLEAYLIYITVTDQPLSLELKHRIETIGGKKNKKLTSEKEFHYNLLLLCIFAPGFRHKNSNMNERMTFKTVQTVQQQR